MWHGDAVQALLADVHHGDAARTPIVGAHSIWTLVLHMTAWADIARDRLHGESLGDPATVRNFPPLPSRISSRAWASARSRLAVAHDRLAAAVILLPDEAMSQTVHGKRHTVRDMIDGVIEHSTYHGGQIALLKRALVADDRGTEL